MAARRKVSSSGPVSVLLPEELRSQVKAEARRRGLGLSATIRILVAERLQESEDQTALSRAEEWQRAQAWASWERSREEGRESAPVGIIHEVFDAVAAASGMRASGARGTKGWS